MTNGVVSFFLLCVLLVAFVGYGAGLDMRAIAKHEVWAIVGAAVSWYAGRGLDVPRARSKQEIKETR